MNPISIALPDGSMQERVTGLLARAGLPVTVGKRRTKEGRVGVPWISRVVFQRPQEIPHYLEKGHFDVAIVGEDWIANWGYDFPVLLKLAIGRGSNRSVRLVLAVHQASGVQQIEDLPQGCEVATEYVQLVQKFFQRVGRPDVRVLPSYGNTEHKIRFGATAIVDVTESGESLQENQLRVIHEIMESCTVVVANSASLADASKEAYIHCFAGLINGANQASQYVFLIANVPDSVKGRAASVIGGLKGPSVSPLAVEGWSALQSVVRKEDEQRTIFELLKIGVTDICVIRDIPLVMS